MLVIDFAWFRPSIAQLKAAGVTGVIRYVGPPGWGKTITQVEFDAYMAAGIDVTLVFEGGADDGAGGFNAGVTNARTALAFAPRGYTGAIYMAVDTGVSGSALDTAVAYIAGASSVIGPARTGNYAEGALVLRTAAAGTATYHWQSESTAFPENDKLQPMTQLWQKVDGSPFPGNADFNLVVKPDYGQHPRPNPSPTPAPEADMAGISPPLVIANDPKTDRYVLVPPGSEPPVGATFVQEHRASIFMAGAAHWWWDLADSTWRSENLVQVAADTAHLAPDDPFRSMQFDADQVPDLSFIRGQLAFTAIKIDTVSPETFRQTPGVAGWGAVSL